MSLPTGVSKEDDEESSSWESESGLESGLESGKVGRLIVPWSSRRARPVGVWRRGGSGLWIGCVGVLGLSGEGAEGRGWSRIEGMLGRGCVMVMAVVKKRCGSGRRVEVGRRATRVEAKLGNYREKTNYGNSGSSNL